MTKKHEELVEEIAKKLWAIQAFPGATDWDRAVEKAGDIIALILSAVRDGRLDEELGVIARIDLWDGAEVGGEIIPSGGHTLIALSREKPGE